MVHLSMQVKKYCLRTCAHVGYCVLQLQIWDTAGQERFRSITQSYYRSANALILTYDITCEDSFRCLPEWLREIEQYANNQVVTILVGKSECLMLCIHVLSLFSLGLTFFIMCYNLFIYNIQSLLVLEYKICLKCHFLLNAHANICLEQIAPTLFLLPSNPHVHAHMCTPTTTTSTSLTYSTVTGHIMT